MLNILRRHVLTKWVALAVVLSTGLGSVPPAGAVHLTDRTHRTNRSDRGAALLPALLLPLFASFTPSCELVCDANGNTSMFTYGSDGIRHTGVVNGNMTTPRKCGVCGAVRPAARDGANQTWY